MNVNETAIKDIVGLIKGLKFGEVIIKVQDSHIVSLEKREKIRLTKTTDPDYGEVKNNRCHTDYPVS